MPASIVTSNSDARFVVVRLWAVIVVCLRAVVVICY